ncbi:hypothetical protein [Pseudonocardia sp. GCM10023141]|uniref:Rv2732c family membrane protein n=1 Tax=Pseudonocardia sp. GCM10023141 TaxID=3252653 RepID=UPI0036228EF3
MTEIPEELRALNSELTGVERRVERRIDPGATAMTISIAMLVLVIAMALLPWTGPAQGWQILTGEQWFGLLPRVFTFTSLGFGLVVSALALATRWWALAWLCAVGCGISVINGVWAIWSRQTGVFDGGSGPAIGMILALLAILVLAGSWARIAFRRG